MKTIIETAVIGTIEVVLIIWMAAHWFAIMGDRPPVTKEGDHWRAARVVPLPIEVQPRRLVRPPRMWQR